MQTLNGQYQCVSECESKMFVNSTINGVSFKRCQSEDACGYFSKQNVTVSGKDA